MLYLTFEIPYVGFLAWLVTTWLGRGTLILAARERVRGSGIRPAGAD